MYIDLTEIKADFTRAEPVLILSYLLIYFSMLLFCIVFAYEITFIGILIVLLLKVRFLDAYYIFPVYVLQLLPSAEKKVYF